MLPIQARTLCPKWSEEFILDVNRIDEDALRIDVWDFNWDENVTDKFRRVGEIKVRSGSFTYNVCIFYRVQYVSY